MNISHISHSACNSRGSYGSKVEALRYEPEGRGFDSQWRHWYFSST